MTEDELHADIVAKLRLLLPAKAVLHHSPNEGKRGFKAQRWLKASGTRPGWPDLEIVFEGKFYGIELKAGKNKPTALQAATHDALFVAGAKVKVCRSLEDVIDALEGWRIPLRGREA